ncbi:MAG: replicative DNA helicase [Candidatus Campbellbacteria bacterium]|nr:replicative DNA helicase [Candidatus Campbellbacteria bacterium]
MENDFRKLPYDEETERALIGAILINPEILFSISDIITHKDFYIQTHKSIYDAISYLYKDNKPIDILSVASVLKDKGEIDEVGGHKYLATLSNSVTSSIHAPHYASIIKRKSIQRNLIQAGEKIAQMGYEKHEEDLEQLIGEADKTIYDISLTQDVQKYKAIGPELSEAYSRFQNLRDNKNKIRGVRTGFDSLDNMLAGLQKSDLIILAARPGVGKTALALDIARKSAVSHNTKVGIFSLEMSAQQLIDRMIASQAQIDAWRLRVGRINSDDDLVVINDAIDMLSRAPIYIDDRPANSITAIRTAARRMKKEKDIDLVIVDYLQLITPSTTRYNDSMVQQITEISRSLKQLARELDLPVLALSQLSREIEKRGGRPRLSDLRDSGSIEQDADVVTFLHFNPRDVEDRMDDHNVQILIEKHRNGPTGKTELHFNKRKITFNELAKESYDESTVGMSSEEEQV